MSLAYLQKKHGLTEEEVIMRFFKHMSSFPDKKDFFIRDFDDYYF